MQAVLIGPGPDGSDAAQIVKMRTVRSARLGAIKADIAKRLGSRDLSITAIAARQGVTPRYVQMLFEDEGTTFSQFVRVHRLLHAHRMLSDPRCAAWKIISIAFAAGFADLSYFNHAFRRAFGETPSDVRAAARRTMICGEPVQPRDARAAG